MIILGIDPGYATVGYGVIAFNNYKLKVLEYGAITTSPELKFTQRLGKIYSEIGLIIASNLPDVIAIEKLYFQNNQKTAIDVAQARGVLLLAAQQAGVETMEFTPLQVKMAITGYGKATKQQIIEMTRRLLGLAQAPKPDDTADALALAICQSRQINRKHLCNK